ncbi:MAG TPA: histidine kinase [Thermoanaerobaculia bacterium]|nr:histidine kinase [Thermoanaerobaculia bacterium]
MIGSVSRALRIVAILLTVWLTFAFFNSSEFYRRAIGSGVPHDWLEVLRFQIQASLLWAAFTPIVMFIAERLPVRTPHVFRNAMLLLSIASVLSVIRSAGGAAVTQWGDGFPVSYDFAAFSVQVRFHRNLFVILVIIGITNFMLAMRTAAEREHAALALKAAVADAEMQRLRATMQPRYVLSTIEAIAAQVTGRPTVADRMLVDLCDLLRATQEAAGRERLTLGEELELIDRYFDLERTLSGGAFLTKLLVDEELLAARVPPLVLRPLVESACLDARASDAAEVVIVGRREEGSLILQVRRDAAVTGIALALEPQFAEELAS